jgi:hypothetical protein
MSNQAHQANVKVDNFNTFAGAWANTTMFDNCATTIDLDNQPTVGGDYLLIQSFANKAEIDYVNSTSTLSYPGGSKSATKPEALGIALTGGQVYYLYRTGAGWQLATQTARPTWMNLTATVTVGFGIANPTAFGGNTASFDNFNLPAVSPADLGI